MSIDANGRAHDDGTGEFGTMPRTEPVGIDLGAGAQVPKRLDPAIAHHIDGHTMMGLLPHVDQRHLSDIRLELARHIQFGGVRSRDRQLFATWQDAWNDMTGATARNDGQIRLRNVACGVCHGKGFDVHHPGQNFARTGNPSICGECRGRRRSDVTVRTRFAPVPQS